MADRNNDLSKDGEATHVARQTSRAAEHAKEAAVSTSQAAQESKRAATHTAAAAQIIKSSAERTTELAADRTVLAFERTYAAWVRTGLFALASGIGARKLLEGIVPSWLAGATGVVLVLFSAFCFGAGVWRQLFHVEGRTQDARELPGFVLVGLNGFLVLVALAVLIGILLGGDADR